MRRYLAGCGLHYGGFFTVWGPDDRLHLLRAADPDAKMTAATAVARRANSRVQAETAAFDHLGCQALEAPAQLLVLDELGFLERDAAAFRRRIQQKTGARTKTLSWRIGQVLTTFVLIDLSWIFFRANSLGDAMHLLSSLFRGWNTNIFFDGSLLKLGLDQTEWLVLLGALLILLAVSLMQEKGVSRVISVDLAEAEKTIA